MKTIHPLHDTWHSGASAERRAPTVLTWALYRGAATVQECKARKRLSGNPLSMIAAGALLLSLAPWAQAADTRPNILFCFADDWGRYAGIYATVESRPSINQVVKTPNIDRVARQGRAFQERLRHRAELHAVPQLAAVRPVFLPHRARRDPAGGAAGTRPFPAIRSCCATPAITSARATRCGARARRPTRPTAGSDYAYEKAGRDFNNFSENATETGPRRDDLRGGAGEDAGAGARQLRGLPRRPQAGPAVLLLVRPDAHASRLREGLRQGAVGHRAGFA